MEYVGRRWSITRCLRRSVGLLMLGGPRLLGVDLDSFTGGSVGGLSIDESLCLLYTLRHFAQLGVNLTGSCRVIGLFEIALNDLRCLESQLIGVAPGTLPSDSLVAAV